MDFETCKTCGGADKDIDAMICPNCGTLHHITCSHVVCWEPGTDDDFAEPDLFDAEVTSVLDWNCCEYQEKRVEDPPPPPTERELAIRQRDEMLEAAHQRIYERCKS